MPTKPPVERITVDEILDRTLVRLLVAPLSKGVTSITDKDDEWDEEREELAPPAKTLARLGLNKADGRRIAEVFLGKTSTALAEPELLEGTPEQLLLRFVKEGQVFLRGNFTVQGDRANPTTLSVCDGPPDTLKIDHMPAVKDIGKDLYARALAGAAAKGAQR